jgi:hypothetical protein
LVGFAGHRVAAAGSDVRVADRIPPAFPDEVAHVLVSNVIPDLALELPAAGSLDFIIGPELVRQYACRVPGADAVDLPSYRHKPESVALLA